MKFDVSDSLVLVGNGIDTLTNLGLRMIDFQDESPEPRVNLVEVPGRDGFVDRTEAMTGDAVYGNGKHIFKFAYTARSISDDDDAVVWDEDEWNEFKTNVKRMIHGRRLEYKLSFDNDYSYTGRFSVKFDGTSFDQPYGIVTIEIDRDPYKSMCLKTVVVNAAGGVRVTLDSGRKQVCPTFEFKNETIVAQGDVMARMQAGTYKVHDIWLKQGMNELYLNSYLGDGNVPMSDYQNAVIADHASKMISDLMWTGIRGAALTVADWNDDSIVSHADMTIADAEYAVSTDTEKYAVYVQYPWLDL